MSMCFVVGALVWSLGVPVPAAVAPAAWWGPPGLCHPLDIGTAKSLPFGEGAFEIDPEFDRSTTTEATIRLLDGGDDSQVHMETLRRAVIYLTEVKTSAANDRLVEAFVVALEARAARATEAARKRGDEPSADLRDAWALATFDLGYGLGLLAEMGHAPRGRAAPLALVEQAVAARPDDGGLRLGAAIVAFTARERRVSYAHLEAALLAEDPSGLLDTNACRTMGVVLGTESRDELAAEVHAALERA